MKSLAVLPLKTPDDIQQGQALSDSFTDSLTSRLGSLNRFAVRPFATVRKHAETGAELKVDFVLDGTIRATKDRLSVEAHLLEVKSGREIWSNKLADADTIRLQDAISNGAAQAMLDQLTTQEREQLARRLPTNIPAYETYSNGFQLWRRRGRNIPQSAAYFKKAIELDASYAQAYVGLASAEMMVGVRGSAEAREAAEALKKALELDDASADAYAAQGFILMFHYWDWEGAEKYLRRALELDPNSVNAHHWLAVYLSIHRRLDEAKAEMQKALELAPTSPILNADMGQLHYFAGEREAAIEYCQKALALDPDNLIASVYLDQINQPKEIGNREATLKLLSRAADQYKFIVPYMAVDPLYDPLREDPRFKELLRKLHLNKG
jgi:tetratricopeptide (TPR) repeat protein